MLSKDRINFLSSRPELVTFFKKIFRVRDMFMNLLNVRAKKIYFVVSTVFIYW
jgi:hypothetical protein